MTLNENIIRLYRDISYQWIIANKYIYQGYLSDGTIGSLGNAEIGHYTGMYHYDRGGYTFHRKTINLSKMVCEYVTKHIYSELPEVSTDSQENADFLRSIIQENLFWKNAKESTEKMIALGDTLIKFWVAENEVNIDFVDGDRFLINGYNGKGEVQDVSIITESEKDGYSVIEFEDHYLSEDKSQYFIKVSVYKNKAVTTRINRNAAFTREQAFGKPISEEIDETGSNIPMFVVIKNPIANNKNFSSPRGIGILTNHYGTVKAINETYDSLSNEITLGRKRIGINETMNQYIELSSGETISGFDRTEGVYEIFGSDGSTEIFKDLSGELRVDPIITALRAQVETMASVIGLTPGTWTVSDKGTITATQIISEKSETALLIKEIEQNLEIGWTNLFNNIINFMKERDITSKLTVDAELEFMFQDNIVVDDEAERSFDMSIVEAGLMPKQQFLIKWYGLTPEEAVEWLGQVEQENSINFDFDDEEEEEEEIIE